MASILKEWRFLNLEERTLTLAKGGNAFSVTYLDDSERRQKLVHFCREFFERPLTLDIKEDRSKDSPAPEGANGEDASSIEEPYEGLPKPVQQVLSVFNGAIKKEDSKKGGSEG